VDFGSLSTAVKRDFLRGNNEASANLTFGDLQIGGSIKGGGDFGASLTFEGSW
jgi:hypothetical protein